MTSRVMGQHVLVVDDDPGTRDLLCRTLSGHCQGRAVGVENTATALSVLRESRIDLIVQDLFRPHGDGLELLVTRQASPSLSSIPVMVLSGQAARYGEQARQLGASLVLEKPVSREELIGAVDAVAQAARLDDVVAVRRGKILVLASRLTRWLSGAAKLPAGRWFRRAGTSPLIARNSRLKNL